LTLAIANMGCPLGKGQGYGLTFKTEKAKPLCKKGLWNDGMENIIKKPHRECQAVRKKHGVIITPYPTKVICIKSLSCWLRMF
jgi:hypothetical protein